MCIIMSCGPLSILKRVKIDGNRLSFIYPVLFNYTKNYNISDFDGLCTLKREINDEQAYSVALIREHKVRLILFTDISYDKKEEVRDELLKSLPDKGAIKTSDFAIFLTLFGIKAFLPRIE